VIIAKSMYITKLKRYTSAFYGHVSHFHLGSAVLKHVCINKAH